MPLPQPGQPFGNWLIERPVGQGGFGAVFRARDPRLNRPIALKVLLETSATDPEDVARFIREARLAAALEHPNVVRIHEVGAIDATPYIAMEWIEGTTLGRARVERPVDVMTIIAETLAFAHERGIVHRDLKPSNVMIDHDGRPKLVDFGIAKRIVPAAPGTPPTFATRDGVVLGTPSYMAPEQEVTSAVDARADQWAWAAMTYELLTGTRPTRPAYLHQALDPRLGAVLLRALAMNPNERFPTMRDLLFAWRAALAPMAAFAPTAHAMPPPAPPPTSSKVPLFIATTVVVAGLACLALGIFLSMRMTAPAPAAATNVPSASATPTAVASASASASASTASAVTGAPRAPVTAKPRPSAAPAPPPVPPGMVMLRTIDPVRVEGSSYVDRDALLPQLRALNPTFARCGAGVVVPEELVSDALWVDVDFLWAGTVRIRWRDARAANLRPCLEAAIQTLKVKPTKENKDAYALLKFDLKR